jgi:hypothetical protein
MKLKFTFLFLLALCLGTVAKAQTEVIIEPDVGFVNIIIMADTNTDGSRVTPDAVYVLRRDGHYYFQGPFENRGFKLHMKAEEGEGKRPYVQSYPDLEGNIAGNMITGYGDIEMENIYFDCDGPDPEARGGGRVLRSEFVGAKIEFTGCVFANCGQNGVMLPKATDYCKIDNCLFVNQGIIAFHDFGNGRVFDCRDSDINLFSLTNSTFVNNVDRIVRHRGGTGVMDTTIVDHCTVINSMAYHGFIELGAIGTSVQLTNLLMIDCMGLGSDSTDGVRLLELDAHTELDGAGNPRMVWVGSIPNDSTTFEIHNNIYTNRPAQDEFFAWTGFVDEGPKWILTEHIKSKLSPEDLATAWVKKDFDLPNIPNTPTDFYYFYWADPPDGAGKQKITTAAVDMDSRGTEYWLDTLDCQLITDDQDFMGSDGVVIGDPYWESEISGTGVTNNYASGIEMLAFPNPVSDQINVRFTLDKSSSVSFDIYDITGKSVRSINAGHFAAGENSVVIQRENLRTGMYLLKMNSETNSGITRISIK